MKNTDNRLLRSTTAPFIATAANIILIFIIYLLARVEFLFENYSLFSKSIEEGRLLNLFGAGFVFDTPGIMYTNALYILLMLIPLHWKENASYYKVCKWVFITVNSVALVSNLVDSVYFGFTGRRTTADVASEFSNESNLLKIMGNEFITHWYLVIFAALLIWGMWKLYVSPKPDKSRISLPRYYILNSICFVIGATICVTGIRGGLLNHWWQYILAIPLIYLGTYLRDKGKNGKIAGIASYIIAAALVATAPIGGWRHRDIRPIAISNANAFTSHPSETGLILNTPFTIIRSIGNSPFSDPGYFTTEAEKEEMKTLFNPVHRNDSISQPFEKKNIVVIIIESFGREYIGGFSRQVLGDSYAGYTPFTDSLMQHSVTFRHSFANGRKSIDGMPSVLSSIPMFVKPFILTPQSLNHISGFPSILKDEGYSSAFFHGARTGSMGFDGYAKSIGFENYYGREDFDRDTNDSGESFDGYWAIWDEPFLQYYAKKMSEMKQPFVTAVFTASSHHPFRVPDQYKDKFKEEELPIHKCIRYTDNALRLFFDTASRQPWFSNTVFVITSDHTNQSNHDEFRSDIGSFSAPFIIYEPGGALEPGMRDGIAQQADILPTILNYIGYSKPFLTFGKDVLRTPASETWAVNYINGVYQYVKHGLVIQFDGKATNGIYRLYDYRMAHNLLKEGQLSEEDKNTAAKMEKELKAIIQTYMDRMLSDNLQP